MINFEYLQHRFGNIRTFNNTCQPCINYCDLSKFLIYIALTKRHVIFTKRLNKMINSNPKF